MAAATFGAEFTGPLPDEPDPEVEPESPLVPPLPLPPVEVLPDEEPSVFAAGFDSAASGLGLLED